MPTPDVHPASEVLDGEGEVAVDIRALSAISWNLAVLALEVKRIADILEAETKIGGALHRG